MQDSLIFTLEICEVIYICSMHCQVVFQLDDNLKNLGVSFDIGCRYAQIQVTSDLY